MSAGVSRADGARGGRRARLWSFVCWALAVMAVPGGMLWALSPLGVQLSEVQFKTPDVFWKMFPSAPLLMLAGLLGMRLWRMGRPGLLERIGIYAAVVGIALIVAGDITKFFLGLDDIFLMSAPGYRAMRVGFIVLALGSMLLGAAGARSGRLPIWGALPFAVCSLAGLIAVARDFESFGAMLWIAFGAGWAWLGFSLLAEGVFSFARGWLSKRRKKS